MERSHTHIHHTHTHTLGPLRLALTPLPPASPGWIPAEGQLYIQVLAWKPQWDGHLELVGGPEEGGLGKRGTERRRNMERSGGSS